MALAWWNSPGGRCKLRNGEGHQPNLWQSGEASPLSRHVPFGTCRSVRAGCLEDPLVSVDNHGGLFLLDTVSAVSIGIRCPSFEDNQLQGCALLNNSGDGAPSWPWRKTAIPSKASVPNRIALSHHL